MDDDLILVGVDVGGKLLADQIRATLKEISNNQTVSYTISLDKKDPLSSEILLDGDDATLDGQTIILCDDVLNSGKTLAYSLSKLLALKVRKVETAVLVLRTHGEFPIYANYKGYELSTTIKEHVEVVPGDGVYLM